MVTSFEGAIPVEIVQSQEAGAQTGVAPAPAASNFANNVVATYGDKQVTEGKLCTYVTTWKSQLRTASIEKRNIWSECWQLYRGVEDFTNKEDWQAKIVLPKAWSSVKQATNVIKRLLSTATKPWQAEAVNPDDSVMALRAGQMTDLTKVLMDQANYIGAFSEALECGFITGLGIVKVWWGMTTQTRTEVQQVMQDGQALRQLVQREILEGRLHIRAVDPYNFYWLPGSRLNKWTGTIEEIEIPKWELMKLADQGVLDPERVKLLRASRIDERDKQSLLRFTERPSPINGPSEDTASLKITEYYGPITCEGVLVEEHGHLIIGGDNILLNPQSIKNILWAKRPTYIGFSPLALPFRTEGVGLIEMVRQIDKSLSRIANMSVDTLNFRLLPIFEVIEDAFENPEDFKTGMHPGKIYRRNQSYSGLPGIQPVQFEDISQGALQVSGQLDRSHQEGALVSEIQQALPRFRGVQSATEIEEKSQNQDSFFGSMAADIEMDFLKPMIELAMDLIFQFIDTANDPRIASILGLGAEALRGMTREELLEIVQGDYKIKVSGITDQLQKAEMLQNLVQMMNIIGQNEEWMPYINKDALLRRVLEAFRPAVHDIEAIIATPEQVAAFKIAAQNEAITPDVLGMMPQVVQMAQDLKRQEAEAQAQSEQAKLAREEQEAQLQLHRLEIEFQERKMKLELEKLEAEIAKIKAEASRPRPTSQ